MEAALADPISGAIAAISTWVSAAAANAAAYAGASVATVKFISTAVYYGTQLAIYAGLSVALVPKVPKPEFGLISLKQGIPVRRRGYGRYRTGVAWVCWEARADYAIDIGALHAGRIDAFEAYYLNDDLVTLTSVVLLNPPALASGVVNTGSDGRYWAPDARVRLATRLGLPTETAYPDAITRLPGFWTSAHRGDGVASLQMICRNGKLANFNHDFPNGEPSPSVVIRAQRVFDPRDVAQDEADPETWAWSNNVALCYMHYLMYDRGYAYDWSSTEVPTFNQAKWNRRFGNTLSYWVDAADICDEAVDLAGGGSEARYTIGGQYSLDQDETAVVNQFLTSMDGWSSTDGQGGFIVYAGKFYEPTVTLTDTEIKGFSLRLGVEAESQVNTIAVTFTDPAKNYNSSEADPWVDEAALAAAGRSRPEPLDLPWVQSHSQARRLAKRRMERHQAACRGSLTVSMAAQAIFGQRFLTIDFDGGPSIMRGLIVEVTGNLRIDLVSQTLSFDWTSVDPDARDGWVPEDEEGTEPPPVEDTTGDGLEVPTITASRVWFDDADVTYTSPRLSLDASGPDRGDLTWQLRWKRSDLILWHGPETIDTEDGDITPTLISSIVQRAASTDSWTIEAQVRYQTGGGQVSDWSASAYVDTHEPTPLASSSTILTSSTYWLASSAP